mgnify:CR=1 FL=1
MNNSELREWLNYHEAAYPGYLKWMQQAENGGDTVVRDRMALWASRVRNLDQTAARAATKAMFDQSVDLYFSKHLGWICDYAQRMRPEPEQFSHLCKLCNNTGIVSVKFKDDRRTYGGNPLPDNVGQAACRCSEGQRVNDGRTGHPDATQFEKFDLQLMAVHEYKADVGRYEIAKRHEDAGRLKLAKLIEEFGYTPDQPKAITCEKF